MNLILLTKTYGRILGGLCVFVRNIRRGRIPLSYYKPIPMKKIIRFLILSAFIIIACNTNKKTGSLISKPDDIKAGEYVVNIDRDTTLETKNGALLKIPKGSLTTDKGNTVTLEIKEAYSMQQMILAGLTTGSNGDPLSSGGMIMWLRIKMSPSRSRSG
jgi:predicted small secreted protein